jgi:hypothetical protein
MDFKNFNPLTGFRAWNITTVVSNFAQDTPVGATGLAASGFAADVSALAFDLKLHRLHRLA